MCQNNTLWEADKIVSTLKGKPDKLIELEKSLKTPRLPVALGDLTGLWLAYSCH